MHHVPTVLAEMMPLTDEELLARVLEGDTPVFELLMRRHNQRLYRVARSVVRDDLEAEDIVQEAYVRAYQHLAGFEGRSSVATWLTRIAFHEALRRRRHRLRAARAAAALAHHQASARRGAEGADMPGGDEAGTMLTEALDSLPTGLRAVITLRLVQGLSTRETAECLRLTEANVKVMLHRGRQALHTRLGPRLPAELREQYAFGAERCGRVVERVFQRLSDPSGGGDAAGGPPRHNDLD